MALSYLASSEAIIRSVGQLGRRRRLVTLNFVNLDQVLQEQRDNEFIDSTQCPNGLFGSDLDKRGHPLHEWFPYKRVLPPAVQVYEAANLPWRDHPQQAKGIGQAEGLHSEENLFERRTMNDGLGIGPGQELIQPVLILQAESRTDERAKDIF